RRRPGDAGAVAATAGRSAGQGGELRRRGLVARGPGVAVRTAPCARHGGGGRRPGRRARADRPARDGGDRGRRRLRAQGPGQARGQAEGGAAFGDERTGASEGAQLLGTGGHGDEAIQATREDQGEGGRGSPVLKSAGSTSPGWR